MQRLVENETELITKSGKLDSSVEVYKVKAEYEHIIKVVKETADKHIRVYGQLKDRIRDLGDNIAKQIEMGLMDNDKGEIASIVYRLCVEQNVEVTRRWIIDSLPEEYRNRSYDRWPKQKNPFKENSKEHEVFEREINAETAFENYNRRNKTDLSLIMEESDPELTSALQSILVDSSKHQELLLNKPMNEMSNDEFRKHRRQTLKLRKFLKTKLTEINARNTFEEQEQKKRGIATDPDLFIEMRDPISVKPTKPGPSLSQAAMIRYGNTILDAAERLYDYPPSPDLDRRFAAALNEMTYFWRPWVDLKFRKDSFSWFFVEQTERVMGRNAAAKRHATQFSPDIQAMLKLDKRPLTREIVTDNRKKVFARAVRVPAAFSDYLYMHLWYLEQIEPEVAKRVVELAPLLQELA